MLMLTGYNNFNKNIEGGWVGVRGIIYSKVSLQYFKMSYDKE